MDNDKWITDRLSKYIDEVYNKLKKENYTITKGEIRGRLFSNILNKLDINDYEQLEIILGDPKEIANKLISENYILWPTALWHENDIEFPLFVNNPTTNKLYSKIVVYLILFLHLIGIYTAINLFSLTMGFFRNIGLKALMLIMEIFFEYTKFTLLIAALIALTAYFSKSIKYKYEFKKYNKLFIVAILIHVLNSIFRFIFGRFGNIYSFNGNEYPIFISSRIIIYYIPIYLLFLSVKYYFNPEMTETKQEYNHIKSIFSHIYSLLYINAIDPSVYIAIINLGYNFSYPIFSKIVDRILIMYLSFAFTSFVYIWYGVRHQINVQSEILKRKNFMNLLVAIFITIYSILATNRLIYFIIVEIILLLIPLVFHYFVKLITAYIYKSEFKIRNIVIKDWSKQ